MATIVNNRYTVGGVTYDAHTGMPVNDTGLTPTQEQLDNRVGAAAGAQPGADLTKAGTPGYDVFGNRVASPTPPPARYTNPDSVPGTGAGGDVGFAARQFSAGGAFDVNQKAYSPEEEEKIRQQERTRVQAQIDAINEAANLELSSARARAKERAGQGRATLAATGQLGSGTESTVNAELANKAAEEERAILAEKTSRIGELLTKVEDRSRDIIAKQKTLARENADAYIKYLGGVSEEARSQFEQLAKAGADLSPTQRQSLIEQTGYDSETFDALYKSLQIANSSEILNKNKPEIIGNKAVYFKQTKDAKGNVSITPVSLDLPDNGKTIKDTVARDDGVYVFYTDGTYEKVGEPKPQVIGEGQAIIGPDGKVIYKNPKTFAPKEGTTTGLNAKQTQNFLRISDKFQADEVMKNYNKIATAGRIADQVLADPSKATNQLKALYSLVKNLDADSAVREGELDLAQKTQSYFERFETSIARLSKGKIINDRAAQELAQATKELVEAWGETAQRRTRQYQSQAGVAGIGTAFDEYLAGFNPVFSEEQAGTDDDESVQARAAGIGSIVTLNGQQYTKTGENAYEPVK